MYCELQHSESLIYSEKFIAFIFHWHSKTTHSLTCTTLLLDGIKTKIHLDQKAGEKNLNINFSNSSFLIQVDVSHYFFLQLFFSWSEYKALRLSGVLSVSQFEQLVKNRPGVIICPLIFSLFDDTFDFKQVGFEFFF